jgi:hypothetical protein
MFKQPTPPAGFAVAAHDERTAPGTTLPVLIAIVALFLSTAVVLTAMTMSAARAAQLF